MTERFIDCLIFVSPMTGEYIPNFVRKIWDNMLLPARLCRFAVQYDALIIYGKYAGIKVLSYFSD